MKKPDLQRYAPVGIRLNGELWTYGLVLCLAALSSLGFFLAYSDAYDSLFHYSGDLKILKAGAVMPDFDTLSLRYFSCFGLVLIVTLSFISTHYSYHHRESKSIYLMRRLSDPWELHRRCLTLPVVGVGLALLVAFVLLALYFAVYMGVTPEECLTPHQWQKIWR